jgi:DNA mismatch repair protein MutS2
VTVRDGRYVIAVRSDKKWQIDGIIHDYSQTRATCFLEPIEAIQDNNRVAELRQEEKTEELRILTSLTDMVRDSAADLEFSQSLIAKLDGLYARARFSDDLSCVMPEIGESCGVELKRAKNPILQALAVEKGGSDQGPDFPVPVDVLLDDQHNVLIISGPNRGGKTVTLKTLGLMSLMAQSGIHIPVDEGSYLRVFDHIIADIGDDQDIQTGLSTFSAHAAHLKFILEHANQRSLVIIDEPGMGTDPDEGVALAMAILDFLSLQRTFVAVSTHLNRLKTYGLLNQRAVNASVEFDVEKKCPTFNLKYGSPGISHALDTARDMGVSQSILDRAKGYLDQDEVHLNRLIEKLNRLMIEAKHEKEEAEEVKRKYHSATRRIKDRLLALEERKRELIESKRIDAEAMIDNAREELKQAINLLKEKKQLAQADVAERYNEVSRKLMDHLEPEGVERHPCEITDIEEGQLVYHKRLRQMGTVRSVDPSGGRVLVILGKVKISAKVQDLEAVKEQSVSGADEGSRSVFWNLNGIPPKEINIIGYRVDDAIPLIDKTIDRALVEGQMTLRIIHGFGTGRLREAIRDHLREVPIVKKFCSADSQFGGDAVTVVELS